MSRTTRNAAVAAVALVALIWHPASWAALSRPQVEDAVAQAQSLAKEQQWSAADTLLKEQIVRCGTGAEVLNCRPLLNYTLAYLDEQHSRAAPEQREALLERAAKRYRTVLDDVPDHGPTHRNLAVVLQQRVPVERAIAALNEAMVNPSPARDVYAVALGDLYRGAQRWDDALHAYDEAMRAKPNSPIPPRRIVETYAQLPAARWRELEPRLASWMNRYPVATEHGYRIAIERAIAKGDDERAARNLLAWTTALARHRRLTPEKVKSLLATWPAKPVAELARYTVTPNVSPDTVRWWSRGDFARRLALSEAALALGHRDLKSSGARAARDRWRIALNSFAPRTGNYPMVRLDLQTELATLYHQYPKLDRGNEFKQVIRGIFESKGDAYQANDLSAIQRHHTVLGNIYSRDPAREENHPAMNAVFQLYYGINAAERRFKNGERYQPLPTLREGLAKACEDPSPVQKRNAERYCRKDGGRSAVAQLYLEAAMAYFDTDELESATRMLAKVGDVAPTAREQEMQSQLRRILATRESVAKISQADIVQSGARDALSGDAHRWLFGDGLSALPVDFLARQRFKTLSDYGLALGTVARYEPVAQAALEDIKPVLTPAARGVVLTGTGDKLRVERLEAIGVTYRSP